MRINKDEAFILWRIMLEMDFTNIALKQIVKGLDKNNIDQIYSQLLNLEHKLKIFSDDKRRKGRKSQNSTTDIFKRYKCKLSKK